MSNLFYSEGKEIFFVSDDCSLFFFLRAEIIQKLDQIRDVGRKTSAHSLRIYCAKTCQKKKPKDKYEKLAASLDEHNPWGCR